MRCERHFCGRRELLGCGSGVGEFVGLRAGGFGGGGLCKRVLKGVGRGEVKCWEGGCLGGLGGWKRCCDEAGFLVS